MKLQIKTKKKISSPWLLWYIFYESFFSVYHGATRPKNWKKVIAGAHWKSSVISYKGSRKPLQHVIWHVGAVCASKRFARAL